MNEKRKNWKSEISEEARQKQAKRDELLGRKDAISKEIRKSGLDFALYDDLKRQQREVIAELATL